MTRIEALGAVLAEHRRSLGLTQARLAELASLTRVQVGFVERGQTRVAIDSLFALCDVLQVRTSEVLAQAEELATRRLPEEKAGRTT
jgi:transcriptional regulator with XRE-family HTH domain